MGFSGGGSNILKPHKHSSAVQDGSPLNMVNVTEASLNAGDVVYSDGNALQRLAIGLAGEVIKTNGAANAPEWGSAGATVLEASAALTGDFTTTSGVFTTVTGLQINVLNSAGGVVMVSATLTAERSSLGGTNYAFFNDGVQIPSSWTAFEMAQAGAKKNISIGTSLASDGSTIAVYVYTGGTLTVRGSAAGATSSINSIGVA